MTDTRWCVEYLFRYNDLKKTSDQPDEVLFRALQNITMPDNLSEEFYRKQDAVLQKMLEKKKIVDVKEFPDGITLCQGDVTTIRADAIVNACNKKMLGCFLPGHHCIDNAIHSFAGLQLRKEMMDVMKKQGHDEPNGGCKVTKGYNLPAKYVFHTVGPIYTGSPQDEIDLRNCYRACLQRAEEMNLSSLVFCCLSTGAFGYPAEEAAEIAVREVKAHLSKSSAPKKVVFNVFRTQDLLIYQKLLG